MKPLHVPPPSAVRRGHDRWWRRPGFSDRRAWPLSVGLAAVLWASGVTTSCRGESTSSGLTARDAVALQDLAKSYVQAVMDEDDSAFAAVYDPDAIQVPPGEQPVVGRAAIRIRFGNVLEMSGSGLSYWGFSGSPDGGDGALAYDHGTFVFAVTKKDASEPIMFAGKYLVIFRKNEEGRWLILREAWTP